jgi:hypothetical protein
MFDFLTDNLSQLKRNRANAKLHKAMRIQPASVLIAGLEFETNNINMLSSNSKIGTSFMLTMKTAGDLVLHNMKDSPMTDAEKILCAIIAEYTVNGFFTQQDIDELSVINLTKMLINARKISSDYLAIAENIG